MKRTYLHWVDFSNHYVYVALMGLLATQGTGVSTIVCVFPRDGTDECPHQERYSRVRMMLESCMGDVGWLRTSAGHLLGPLEQKIMTYRADPEAHGAH